MKERGNPLLRFLDRYIGIGLVSLFTLRRKRKVPRTIEKIAILKSAGIGDLIFMSGVIYDLRRALPSAQITLYTGKANRCAAELIEGIDVVALPMTNPFRAWRIIRSARFDVWIDGDPWPRISALLTLLSRSRFTIGFHTPKQHRHFGYDAVAEHSPKDHEIDSLRRLMIPLGIPCSSLPKLSVPTREKERLVILHQFPGGSRACLKRWDKWQEVANSLLAKGYRVVVTGGKGDKSTLVGVEDRVGKERFVGTAELIASAFCVITVDTGILHLSAAIGTFTIGLHGPTFPHRCGGLGENVVAITPNMAYTPCIYLGFESKCSTNRCMQAITVEQVMNAFEEKERACESDRIGRRERDAALAYLP